MEEILENMPAYEKAYKLICMKLNVDCLRTEQSIVSSHWYISSPQLSSVFETSSGKILYSLTNLSCDEDIVKFLVKESRKDNIYCRSLCVVPKDSTLESFAIEFDLNWNKIHS